MTSLKNAASPAKFSSTGSDDAPSSSGPPSESSFLPNEPGPAPHERLRHFALSSDGRLLLNVEDLKGYDLTRREVFVGVVLTPAETQYVYTRFLNAAAETASKLLGALKKILSRGPVH